MDTSTAILISACGIWAGIFMMAWANWSRGRADKRRAEAENNRHADAMKEAQDRHADAMNRHAEAMKEAQDRHAEAMKEAQDRHAEARDRHAEAMKEARDRHAEAMKEAQDRHAEAQDRHAEAMAALSVLIERTAPQPIRPADPARPLGPSQAVR